MRVNYTLSMAIVFYEYLFMIYKNTGENYVKDVLHENLKTHFDIDNYSIFLKREIQKQKVKKTTMLKFESIVDGDNFSIPAMLYEPEKADQNITLYFHGGGWVRGSIESHDCLCRKIANTLNIRILSVEYRLAPWYRFPTALNDALSVYCGLFNNNDVTFEKVIIAGDSSGGNLSASLCIKLREKGFSKLPISQILFYPVLSNDFQSESFQKFGNEINLTKSMMKWFIYMYTGKEFDDENIKNNKLIYPLLEEDMSVFPKTLIISAKEDILLDGQTLFASKLKKAGIETYQYTVDNTKHGFLTYGNEHWKFTSTVLEEIKKYELLDSRAARKGVG
ncbi:MAG: alpha/beta hydrolase [Puniceicoccales bacterium]|jgi:acetyl esterase|nr:alpha/beta hydrolase [Puniceicoccales bacterium]